MNKISRMLLKACQENPLIPLLFVLGIAFILLGMLAFNGEGIEQYQKQITAFV